MRLPLTAPISTATPEPGPQAAYCKEVTERAVSPYASWGWLFWRPTRAGRSYYVRRCPPHHLDLQRCTRDELTALGGRLKGHVWARKYHCAVYGVQRCVVDGYSRRIAQRHLPGLRRDRDL